MRVSCAPFVVSCVHESIGWDVLVYSVSPTVGVSLRRVAWVCDMERYWVGEEVERAQKSTTWKPWVLVMRRDWCAFREKAVPVEAGMN